MISLENSIRTCKVETGSASRLESDRFLNSCNVTCPVWNGQDSAGRFVCEDSFYTKSPGCNSAVDRVDVENYQRPQYFDYVNLDGYGIQGNLYGQSTVSAAKAMSDVHNLTGQFGEQFRGNTLVGDTYNKYEKGMISNMNERNAYGPYCQSMSARNFTPKVKQQFSNPPATNLMPNPMPQARRVPVRQEHMANMAKKYGQPIPAGARRRRR